MSIIIRDIGIGFVPMSFHCIYIKSNLGTGFFLDGVCSCISIGGIYLIIGSDIAGGKIYPASGSLQVPISNIIQSFCSQCSDYGPYH